MTRSGYTSTVFRLNTIDKDFAEATAQALEELTGRRPNIREHPVKRGRNNHALSHACPDLCRALVEDTISKAVIPAYVWWWGRDNKLAFIAGLMDSEGFVAAKSGCHTDRRFYMGFKSCDEWVPDFVRLLHHVGIQTGKVSQEKPRKEGYKVPTRFHIKMQSWVDSGARFSISRKQERVDAWAACEPYSQRSRFPRKLTSEANMPGTASR